MKDYDLLFLIAKNMCLMMFSFNDALQGLRIQLSVIVMEFCEQSLFSYLPSLLTQGLKPSVIEKKARGLFIQLCLLSFNYVCSTLFILTSFLSSCSQQAMG